ncbi:MAG: DUF5674 family protein [Anaerolineae bacterium]
MASVVILREAPSPEQMKELLGVFETFIKLAVDVRREVVAAGGEMHSDCEEVLLEDGSLQEDIWGADWEPATRKVYFESLINIRPRQSNLQADIQDPLLRAQVEKVVRRVFEGA